MRQLSYVAQVGLELIILLQPSECWGNSSALPCPDAAAIAAAAAPPPPVLGIKSRVSHTRQALFQ
jgi:hypothetical protein